MNLFYFKHVYWYLSFGLRFGGCRCPNWPKRCMWTHFTGFISIFMFPEVLIRGNVVYYLKFAESIRANNSQDYSNRYPEQSIKWYELVCMGNPSTQLILKVAIHASLSAIVMKFLGNNQMNTSTDSDRAPTVARPYLSSSGTRKVGEGQNAYSMGKWENSEELGGCGAPDQINFYKFKSEKKWKKHLPW